jgi:hypothetical protein
MAKRIKRDGETTSGKERNSDCKGQPEHGPCIAPELLPECAHCGLGCIAQLGVSPAVHESCRSDVLRSIVAGWRWIQLPC